MKLTPAVVEQTGHGWSLPQPKIDATGWEDLLASLTPDQVEQTGQGWSLKNGQLVSLETKWATLPVPGKWFGTSYQVRVKLPQLTAKDVFHVVLPVGDRMTGFELDGDAGKDTGLQNVDGKKGQDGPGILEGKQVTDSDRAPRRRECHHHQHARRPAARRVDRPHRRPQPESELGQHRPASSPSAPPPPTGWCPR